MRVQQISTANDSYRRKLRQLDVFRRGAQRADRIISGTDVEVRLANVPTRPAGWSDGQTITFNKAHIDAMDMLSLTEMYGLNYHELAHIMYTPRMDTTLVRRVLSWGCGGSFNILEDQRIETLLVGRFPSVAPYLVAMMGRWVLQGGSATYGEALPLVWGRRYLPQALRRQVRDAFHRPRGTQEICDIIDEYRTMVFPKDDDRASGLILRFHDLVDSPSKCKSGWAQSDGAAEPQEEQEYDVERVEEAEAEAEGEAEGGGAVAKAHHINAVEAEKISRAVDEAVRGALHDQSVVEDMERTFKRATSGDGAYEVTADKGDYPHRAVSAGVMSDAKKFADVLRVLVEDTEPDWDRGTPSGRLNVGRVMHGGGLDDAFDRWDTGGDGYDIEAMIAVDNSASMAPGRFAGFDKITAASILTWLLTKSVREIGGECTSVAFSDEVCTVYGKHDKVDGGQYKYLEVAGGTYATEALAEAEQLFTASKRANKILIIITDGDWSNEKEANEAIERIKQMGVTVACAYIEGSHVTAGVTVDTLRVRYGHGAEVFGVITNTEQTTEWGKKVVTSTMKKRASQHY